MLRSISRWNYYFRFYSRLGGAWLYFSFSFFWSLPFSCFCKLGVSETCEVLVILPEEKKEEKLNELMQVSHSCVSESLRLTTVASQRPRASDNGRTPGRSDEIYNEYGES